VLDTAKEHMQVNGDSNSGQQHIDHNGSSEQEMIERVKRLSAYNLSQILKKGNFDDTLRQLILLHLGSGMINVEKIQQCLFDNLEF